MLVARGEKILRFKGIVAMKVYISGLDCLISGLDFLISGLDCLLSGLDFLISGLDCLICATFSRRGKKILRFKGIVEMQVLALTALHLALTVLNLALTVLHVPSSLDAARRSCASRASSLCRSAFERCVASHCQAANGRFRTQLPKLPENASSIWSTRQSLNICREGILAVQVRPLSAAVERAWHT
jgi:hypothetical protein